MVDRHSLPTEFIIYQELDTGIYECGPIGVRHLEDNYPIWVIASLDLKDLNLKKNDLVKVSDFRSYYREKIYYTAMINDRLIIAEPQTEFRESVNKNYHNKYDEDEDEDVGAPWPRSESISEEEKASVVTHVKELITDHEKPFNTPRRGYGIPRSDRSRSPNKMTRRWHGTLRSDQYDRSRSPNKMTRRWHGTLRSDQYDRSRSSNKMTRRGRGRGTSRYYTNNRSRSPIHNLFSSPDSTIPPTIPHFKKSKKSSRKSLNKSKTSIKCKKTPYAWKSSSIKKSPFRTLKRAKDAEARYKAGQPIGFTAISSLKSQGRIPRSDGCYVLGAKYSALKRH
jgi:hypothetical protein